MYFRNRMPFYRQVAFPLLLAQLAMTLLLGLTGWLFFSRVVGLSAGLGGLIAWIPNLYFAYKSFRYFGA